MADEGAAPARHRVAWDVNRMEASRRMVIAEPLWVTSSRTTHVDVMCTSNTVRRYVAPGEKERQQSKSKARGRLPYASNASAASVTRNPGTATPTQRLMDEIARKKMNEAMHEERRLFMQRLVEERDAKAERETFAEEVHAWMRRPMGEVRVLDASKESKEAAFANMYVISVTLLVSQ